MEMEIKPRIGLGEILLGMTSTEVREILGKPETDVVDKELGAEILTYWDDSLDFDFDDDVDNLLSRITIRHRDAYLNSRKPIGISEGDFLKYFPKAKLEEDYSWGEKDYYVEHLDLSFWICDGKVDNITIFPRFSEDGEIPIWPK